MGLLVLVLSALGGLSAVMGIITAAEIIPTLSSELTWMFWLGLAGVFFLACITVLIARGGFE